MANPSSPDEDRVGPFVAGSQARDLIGLAQHPDLGLRVVDLEEQKHDYYRQRCENLAGVAKEFFYVYDGTASLIFQKSSDTEHIPEFVQYIYCWLVQDRLSGLILSGVSSDAGTHEQIDQQENAYWGHAAEVAEALSIKYPQNLESLVNYFHFELYPVLPRVPDIEPNRIFTGFPRLVAPDEVHQPAIRIETQYWGPSVVPVSKRKLGPDVATATAHTSQSARRIFCNDRWFSVYNHAIERYVRTIESLHASTNLVYISRPLMDDLGRTLNARRGAEVEAEARREIEGWEESLRQAQAAKQARISRLSRIL